jgi:hypothetical protein
VRLATENDRLLERLLDRLLERLERRDVTTHQYMERHRSEFGMRFDFLVNDLAATLGQPQHLASEQQRRVHREVEAYLAHLLYQ